MKKHNIILSPITVISGTGMLQVGYDEICIIIIALELTHIHYEDMRTGDMIIFNMIHVSCECITKLKFKEPCTNFNPAYKTMIHNRPSFHYS